VTGAILEIGFGTGLNLPCYPNHVRKLAAIEPNRGMDRRARKRISASTVEVELRHADGEQLPFDQASFDCVVSTFTLCSVANASRAVGEIYRVLRPGGRFLFLEHGLSPEAKVQRWQRRLNWVQRRLAGNCHLDRDMQAIIGQVPFAKVELSQFYLEQAPRAYGYMYQGAATKS
jgi:ubiquinone/menaquinone biosynthesis C-methylase UbiE